jgi:redox-sensitive bicupin YhaK (pirin superfamily)
MQTMSQTTKENARNTAMLTVRRASDRGHFDHGWLDTHHTFSFGGYRDPNHMGFGALRVINEDRVKQGMGFGEHPHRDMEIISWVLDGALEHGDSLGTRMVLKPGDVQVMTAGTGIQHYEKNGHGGTTHFYQIWIEPKTTGAAPAYEQRTTRVHDEPGKLHVLASGFAADLGDESDNESSENSVIAINQNARFSAGVLVEGSALAIDGAATWVQVARGTIRVETGDGSVEELHAGDGVAIQDTHAVMLRADANAEVLVFEMGEA